MDIRSLEGSAGGGGEWTNVQASSTRAVPEARRAGSASVTLLGVEVLNRNMDEALAQVETMMAARASTSLFFVNAHTLNTAVGDPVFRRLLNESELVFPDGTGARWAAACRGVRLKANLNGTDFVPALLARGRDLRCFVLGATPEIAAGAAEHIHQQLSRLCSRRSPSRLSRRGADAAGGRDDQRQWRRSPVGRHGQSAAGILDREQPGAVEGTAVYRCRRPARLLGRRTDRAPQWMRRRGIEWLHVLRRHPWKFRRYVLGNPLFLARMLMWLPADLRQRLTEGGFPSPASATPESSAMPSISPPR